jgi:hypothetical protein
MLRETGAGMSVRNSPRRCKRCSLRALHHVFLTGRHPLETSLHRLTTGGGAVNNWVQPATSRSDRPIEELFRRSWHSCVAKSLRGGQRAA